MSSRDSDQESNAPGFSEQERTAMKERATELRKEKARGRGNKKAAEELDVLSKIADMDAHDRRVAERIHALITNSAPDWSPKLWYGQPAYARNGKVVCFFRSGSADKERYSTFGFTAEAGLDDDSGLWATSFAVTELGEKAETTLTKLLKKAVG